MNYIKQAVNIRAFEQSLLNAYSKGHLNGTVHTCIGQELFPVLLSEKIKHLRKLVVSNHRGHGHFLGLYPQKEDELLQEIMGLPNGVSGGYGGSQHLIGDEFLSNGIQGGMIPTLAGAVEALKRKGVEPCIGVGYIGDGTLGQGVLYESLNFIGIRKLPILIVLDDNNYAQSTNTSTWINGLLDSRFKGFGLEYTEINMRVFDGDFNSLNTKIDSIINNVLLNKPTVIRVLSNRLKSHSKGDDNRPDDYIKSINSEDFLTRKLTNDTDLHDYFERRLRHFENRTEYYFNSDQVEFPYKQTKNHNLSFQEQQSYHGTFNHLINRALRNTLNLNNDLLMLGEDIRDVSRPGEKLYGGAFKVTKGLSTEFDERLLNCPISEQLIVGFALGYSLRSSGSIAEIMFGDFLTLTLDQLLQHAAKFKTMYGVEMKIPFIVRTPMGGKRGYGPTHSQSLEKHFLGINGLNVFALNHRLCPDSFYKEILATQTPTLIIENKILYTLKYRPLPEFYEFTSWTNDHFVMEVKGEEPIATIFCYGEGLNVAEQVADILLDEEEYLRIICCTDLNSSLENFKWDNLIDSSIITIEEGSNVAAWSSLISSSLLTRNIKLKSFNSIGNNQTIPSNLNAELNILSNTDLIINHLHNRNA